MKLVIPPECQMGCRIIKIRFSDRILDWKEQRADESTKEEIIRLHTKQSDAATFETLLHEAKHISNYLYNVEEKEQSVDIASEALCQFLLSLGIEPDFSQIPEEEF